MPISYYAVGSWDDWAAFHLLCLDEATGLYGAKLECRWLSSRRETIPVRKAPGVEEFQIVENKSWARRFFPVDGGQSIAGPKERHGANWRAEIPCRCRDLHVSWDPVGQRDVKWQFLDCSGKPLGRPVVSRKSATATFFLVGSWNDWQDFLELRPRLRPRKQTLAVFGGQRDPLPAEVVRAFAELFWNQPSFRNLSTFAIVGAEWKCFNPVVVCSWLGMLRQQFRFEQEVFSEYPVDTLVHKKWLAGKDIASLRVTELTRKGLDDFSLRCLSNGEFQSLVFVRSI
eukprot:s2910_g10.t1